MSNEERIDHSCHICHLPTHDQQCHNEPLYDQKVNFVGKRLHLGLFALKLTCHGVIGLVIFEGVCLCRAQLAKERQQREDAVRQRKEMEERLRLYEEEYEKAKRGKLCSCLELKASCPFMTTQQQVLQII